MKAGCQSTSCVFRKGGRLSSHPSHNEPGYCCPPCTLPLTRSSPPLNSRLSEESRSGESVTPTETRLCGRRLPVTDADELILARVGYTSISTISRFSSACVCVCDSIILPSARRCSSAWHVAPDTAYPSINVQHSRTFPAVCQPTKAFGPPRLLQKISHPLNRYRVDARRTYPVPSIGRLHPSMRNESWMMLK